MRDLKDCFFISDTHMSHANILHLGAGRPFKDINHHDETIIANWNAVVSPDDTVIHLGDVALGPIEQSMAKIARCNGYKILVPGNHDRVSSLASETRRERFRPLYESVFNEIWDETVTAVLGGHTVLLSHYPYRGDSRDVERHQHLRPVDTGLPLIHGHTHKTYKDHDGSMYHVGVDGHDYTPVHGSVILSWLNSL